MEFRQLGGSGFKVPALCLGTGTFGGKNEFFRAWGATQVEEAIELVDLSLEAGLSMFDSADVYSDGASEEILGKAIKGRRDQVLISTKATFRSGPGQNDVGSSRHHLIQACEASLRRLGTDYIDLYQLHGFDALTPRRRNAQRTGRHGSQWQSALRWLLEFLRVAPDEVARGFRKIWVCPLRGASGLLFTARA